MPWIPRLMQQNLASMHLKAKTWSFEANGKDRAIGPKTKVPTPRP